MDLFDFGTYFSSHVPIKALTEPLLKCAACACAAKQLGRITGIRDTGAGGHPRLAQPSSGIGEKSIDWYYCGAKYYDRAIQLLMKTLQGDDHDSEMTSGGEISHRRERSRSTTQDHGLAADARSETPSDAKSDEVLAATAILCVYEFLDASGPAWNRHLSGAKSLLDVAQRQMICTKADSLSLVRQLRFSAARKAIFWNFARQDYLSGCESSCIKPPLSIFQDCAWLTLTVINEKQSRLDTDDLSLWKAAGLLLDDEGFVTSSYHNIDAPHDTAPNLIKEDMLSNALVWLLAKLSNFIAAGEDITVDLDSESDTISPFGISQKNLLQRWQRLKLEVEVWHHSLPDTFAPCARVSPTERGLRDRFSEIWYSIPMCASAMQNFHMAQILLLINKPHESTARRTTVTERLKSYNMIADTTRYHAREICGISLSRLEGSAHVHSLQPLFVAGQCFTDPEERALVLDLLRDIERERGWATEFRVQQLLQEWGRGDT
jgi:Fungal specific transcription factor domain